MPAHWVMDFLAVGDIRAHHHERDVNGALIGTALLIEIMVSQHFPVVGCEDDVSVVQSHSPFQKAGGLTVQKCYVAIIPGPGGPEFLPLKMNIAGHHIAVVHRRDIPGGNPRLV